VKASELLKMREATVAEARKHPAAHPDVIATSSEKGMGIPELRAAVLESISA
jgi:GTP-binding protein